MQRIEFIGVRGGHGTTTVALAAAATLATRGPTRLATHDRRSLCATVGIAHDGLPIPLADNLDLVDGLDGDVYDAGTLEHYLDDEPFPDFCRDRRDSAPEPLRIAVLRGPDYLGVRTLCAHPDAQLDGVVVINEPGRALDPRDVEHVCGRAVIAVVVGALAVIEVGFTDVLEALASEPLSDRLSEHPERIAARSSMVRADHVTRPTALRPISMCRWKTLPPLLSTEKQCRLRGDAPGCGCIDSAVVSPDQRRASRSNPCCCREVRSGDRSAMRSVL